MISVEFPLEITRIFQIDLLVGKGKHSFVTFHLRIPTSLLQLLCRVSRAEKYSYNNLIKVINNCLEIL